MNMETTQARLTEIRSTLKLKQAHCYEQLCWLFDRSEGARAAGRSTVLALAILETAIARPDEDVPLFDHDGGRDTYAIRQCVRDLARKVGIEDRLSISLGAVRFTPEEKPRGPTGSIGPIGPIGSPGCTGTSAQEPMNAVGTTYVGRVDYVGMVDRCTLDNTVPVVWNPSSRWAVSSSGTFTVTDSVLGTAPEPPPVANPYNDDPDGRHMAAIRASMIRK